MNSIFKKTSTWLRVFFILLLIGICGILWQWNRSVMVEIKSAGGEIREGIVGAPRFINPVLAQSQADFDLTRLLFTPLLTIETDGTVQYLMAENIEISSNKVVYTLILKSGITFEDGTVLDADDVLFTINAIQDPLIKSPLYTKWQGVSVAKVDDQTLIFTLDRPYADFLHNFELGILPKHIWQDVNPQEFIFSIYNTNPIGNGPYKVKKVKTEKTGVPAYYQLVRSRTGLESPYITSIQVLFFDNQESLLEGLEDGKIDTAYGISPQYLDTVVDDTVLATGSLPRIFGIFFNQENQPLLQSLKVRTAIDHAINKQGLVEEIFGGYASAIDSPFGFESHEDNYRLSETERLLESENWVKNSDGFYSKTIDGAQTVLSFSLAIPNVEEMRKVAEYIQHDLHTAGIQMTIRSYDQGNLNQNIIRPREYESLLFGYEIEKPSDAYAFWHSSQISDPGLNISLFKNKQTDTLLEKLRTQSDEDLSDIDQSITSHVPAVFLYSPSYLYLLAPKVHDASLSVTQSSDRFNTIADWYIETRHVWKFFIRD